jgi:hypothetical protein
MGHGIRLFHTYIIRIIVYDEQVLRSHLPFTLATDSPLDMSISLD